MASSKKIEFEGAFGHMLAGRLELPPYRPKIFALFAHCFTCSKDIAAASRIARSLCSKGVGVLRFDFTGLGNSEGDFASTDFSSNIEDLVAASRYLEVHYEAPKIMIGHSLGGAAVLAAASEVDSAEAVVTIGAPSDPGHVTKLFPEKLSEIRSRGKAEVELGGRKFSIASQFLEDLKDHKLENQVATLDKALLIMHSPQDDTVSIDHARKIYTAAKHPKSFVSLDGADHLLSRAEDSVYVAHLISAWIERYLPEPLREESLAKPRGLASGKVAVESRTTLSFTQDVLTSDHWLLSDEPEAMGGGNRGMTPYDLLLASLGTCTSMTLQMYARHKKWDLKKVRVELEHKKIHAKDCEACTTEGDIKIDEIRLTLHLEGDLSEEQRQRLLEIADRCPVHRTLHSETHIATELA